MENYIDEKNALVLLALLKKHKIKKIIASPGSTNVAIVTIVQNDPFFEVYSAPDERSAAYIACGLAAESSEPVAISCTGATSSRNYLPGLTEAYYRKLPVLAITSTQSLSKVGHHIAQVIDRSVMPKDVVKLSLSLPIIKDDNDLWECEIKSNQAILELTRNGGGPVHINIPTTYIRTFNTVELPEVRVINRIFKNDTFPKLPEGKIGIFVGSHKIWTDSEIESIDSFCETNDAVVFCDHTSNYKGKYRVLFSLLSGQRLFDNSIYDLNLLIYIGEITGDYFTMSIGKNEVWRVNEDGEIRDTFGKLSTVFEMPEANFFKAYSSTSSVKKDAFLKSCNQGLDKVREKIDKIEIPFSNIWIASKLANRIPENSTIHFGILNSLRSWNFFELPLSVTSSSNVGGFGIDGNVSSLLGASLYNKEKLYFGIIGDLAFFYDMNAAGNRHVFNNLRILVVNNGKGSEFRLGKVHPAFEKDDKTDEFISASGHYGNKSLSLLKNYAESLNYEYFYATNKREFEDCYERFVVKEITEKPMIFEVFTDSSLENTALYELLNIENNNKMKAKAMAGKILGAKGKSALKKIIK